MSSPCGIAKERHKNANRSSSHQDTQTDRLTKINTSLIGRDKKKKHFLSISYLLLVIIYLHFILFAL